MRGGRILAIDELEIVGGFCLGVRAVAADEGAGRADEGRA